MSDLKITEQDSRIINYLSSKNGQEVSWEELAQFSKDPQNVKLNTIKKTISEIKRKYKESMFPLPFNVSFVSLVPVAQQTAKSEVKAEQKLVRVIKEGSPKANLPKPQAQIDFVMDPLGFKRVRTKYGIHQLNDSEWDMFKYLHKNAGKLVSISELRDNVVYPNYGSKLPARWFDAIMRIVNNMRRQIVGLDKRLLTVKSEETCYIFQ